ncbi:MAG: tetratricopeptide repeat protein, partial [Polyangiales bacterium]
MRATLLLSLCAALCLPATALAWSPLRAENPNVKRGNELMAQEQYADALEAYDSAARELPEDRGVQLNRGLALLAQGLTEPAREAFTAAADPAAPPEVRADAYYDLGISHAREGDVASEQEDFEQASAHFREAADALKRALRARPGDRNAAWNLEYSLKRIREVEEKQEQNQDQEQEQNQEQEQEQNQEQ